MPHCPTFLFILKYPSSPHFVPHEFFTFQYNFSPNRDFSFPNPTKRTAENKILQSCKCVGHVNYTYWEGETHCKKIERVKSTGRRDRKSMDSRWKQLKVENGKEGNNDKKKKELELLGSITRHGNNYKYSVYMQFTIIIRLLTLWYISRVQTNQS